MYAGTTIRRGSGRIVGVHQKINRAARRELKRFVSKTTTFPSISSVLYFEGDKGPDGIKRKSPSVDEPWHYIDPSKSDDCELLTYINDHMFNLVVALKNGNNVRSAFEAAWLAHAIVDGLTPSHHYPMGDKIQELWGKSHEERSSVLDKNIIHGENGLDTLLKNWEYWGAGGVFTTHYMFELGVASASASETYKDKYLTGRDINKLGKIGYETMFLESVQKVYDLGMYEELGRKRGWTRNLARKTRKILIPEMIKMVSLAWYQAVTDSKRE
jgi:hypothetical protein